MVISMGKFEVGKLNAVWSIITQRYDRSFVMSIDGVNWEKEFSVLSTQA